jgi:hypothetical protein
MFPADDHDPHSGPPVKRDREGVRPNVSDTDITDAGVAKELKAIDLYRRVY